MRGVQFENVEAESRRRGSVAATKSAVTRSMSSRVMARGMSECLR